MTKPRKILPSYERLHELFTYCEWSGILRWKKPNSNKVKKGDVAGYIIGYHLAVSVDDEQYLIHRVVWKMILNEEPPEEIDHKNTNQIDNSWDNLREAIRGENMANSKLSIANNSGVKGVSFHKNSGLWRARIMMNYKDIHIGYFRTKEEAAIARKTYAVKIRGEFAREGES